MSSAEPLTGIHPTAQIDPGADLGADVAVGPFAVIEGDVTIGDGCRIGAHAVIRRYTTLGPRCRVWEHAMLGGEPQDVSFHDQVSRLEIGADNLIREGATIHRATTAGGSTRIGDGNFLMANCHVAHDCKIGDRVIIANGALLAGHVSVADRAFISGNVVIHQFARVGTLAMVGGLARISQDCLPYMITEGSPAGARGLNLVGLRRAGFGVEQIRALKQAFRTLFRAGRSLQDALAELDASACAEVRSVAEFARATKRGFTHGSA
ncbi:MAG TPA: acyl-ACP--UDP-N-acetylglucosamine O-acyltransferase [Burkholderiales bacterium]|nr:acyl-ACP--UDP-N-acetylglucosamine O-acyltransferase [Betaproteobacteria bacterium]HQR51660.1 acyl-ACP--UDP-N-acetylglucosamine O-acyltransferase [Burkholderiales bacterium]